MKNEKVKLSSSEKELNQKIESGKVKAVFIPRLVTASDILKYQLCSEIIKYKKKNELEQADIVKMIDVNKSEVSKIFSYKLTEFSSDRLLGMVESLIKAGANIHLNDIFDEVKKKVNALEKKLKTVKHGIREAHS